MQLFVNFLKVSQYSTALTVSIAAVFIGMTVGWTGNITDVLLAGQYNNIPISETLLSWIVSSINLGSLVFTIPCGIVGDVFGRKIALLFLTIPTLLGCLLIYFATSVNFILIGRFLNGVSNGTFYGLIPIYLTEIGETKIRGKVASFYQPFSALGVLLSFILGYLTNIKLHTMFIVLVQILFFVTFLFQVESPVYKAKIGKYEEAKMILSQLRRKSHDVSAELEEIKLGLEQNRTNISIREVVKRRSTKLAFIISVSLVFFQQFSGSIMVYFYVFEIFDVSGSTLNHKQATIFIGTIRVISAVATSSVMELFTRKKLLSISSFSSGLGLIILGLYYTLNDYNLVSENMLSTLSFMPILGLSVFIVMSTFGLNTLPQIVTAELFPIEAKSIGVSIVGCFNWFFLFLISQFYSNLKTSVGGDGTFYIFACVCFTSGIFAIFALPETKGKSFEDIQYNLNNKTKLDRTCC
ncbi:hypothetical protein FQR65_LT03066 [Abscondita terminalis]|nr:hypothetical protein FQR65_LT03066 [Abscondita terminalis]